MRSPFIVKSEEGVEVRVGVDLGAVAFLSSVTLRYEKIADVNCY